MTTILEKKGDNIARAVNYIDEQLKANKGNTLMKLISDAGARFNLTPKDEEYLQQLFKDRKH
jgi:hypothetical protein